MNLKLLTPPTTNIVTLAEAKAQLRIEDTFTSDDAYIGALVTAATNYVEKFCNRRVITQVWKAYYDSFEAVEKTYIPYGQLQSVVAVTYLDEDGDTNTVSTSDYIVGGLGTDEGHIEFDDDYSRPTDLYQVEPVRVEFRVGYYNAKAWVGSTSKALGDQVLANYGLVAQCTTAGTTGTTEPTWTGTLEDTISDNTVTWTLMGQEIPKMLKQAALLVISQYYENHEPIVDANVMNTLNSLMLPYRIWGAEI